MMERRRHLRRVRKLQRKKKATMNGFEYDSVVSSFYKITMTVYLICVYELIKYADELLH